MSSLKIQNIQNTQNTLIGLFYVSWGLINLGVKPVVAEEVPQEQSISRLASFTSSSLAENVSTRAIDLLSSKEQEFLTDNKLPSNRLAQRELDLERFCQNYPHNSQCAEVNPSNVPGSKERSPIPVTVPPASNSQNSNSRSRSGWAIVPEVSTLGFGGHVVRKITPNFNARVGVNAFGLGIDIEETDLDFEGDLNLFNVSTIVDVHPFKRSGFRVSGGLLFSDNNFGGTANISEELTDEIIEIEDLDLNGLATVDADIDVNNSVAPYLGIGGGNAVGEGKGLGFWWNLGVVFGGSPEVEVSANISDEIPEVIREVAQAAADNIAEEEEEDLEDELDFINIYPVVSLGLSYQF